VPVVPNSSQDGFSHSYRWRVGKLYFAGYSCFPLNCKGCPQDGHRQLSPNFCIVMLFTGFILSRDV
jgi:hypothetical protein